MLQVGYYKQEQVLEKREWARVPIEGDNKEGRTQQWTLLFSRLYREDGDQDDLVPWFGRRSTKNRYGRWFVND